jgi:hypothetical protein
LGLQAFRTPPSQIVVETQSMQPFTFDPTKIAGTR